MTLRNIFVVVLIFCVAFAAQAQWNIQTIDNSGNAGTRTDIAYDQDGNPHVVWVVNNNTLMYSYWTGAGWAAPTSIRYSANGVTDGAISIAANGDVQVALLYKTNGGATGYVYHKNLSTDAVTTYNIGNSIGFCDLLIGPGPWYDPHILYQVSTTVRHYWYNHVTSAWVDEAVDQSANVGDYISAAMDANESIHVAYYDAGGANLKYARKIGSTWNVMYVDESGSVGNYCSLAVDADNIPHISYYDATNRWLKYATIQP